MYHEYIQLYRLIGLVQDVLLDFILPFQWALLRGLPTSNQSQNPPMMFPKGPHRNFSSVGDASKTFSKLMTTPISVPFIETIRTCQSIELCEVIWLGLDFKWAT